MSNNIILIGMRGSGKSTVATILSEKLGIPVIDTDQKITQQEGMSIKAMIEKHGWMYFREKETDLLRSLNPSEKFILSTGGGMILLEENRKRLRELGTVYYLFISPEVSATRIKKHDESRPALKSGLAFSDELATLFKEREKIYEDAADHIIHTELIPPEEVAELVLAYFSLPA